MCGGGCAPPVNDRYRSGAAPQILGRSPMNDKRSLTVGRSHHHTSGGKAATADLAGSDSASSPNVGLPQSPRAHFSFSPRLIFWQVVAVVLLYDVIYPNLHVVVASLQQEGNWSLANYREVLSQSIVLESIFASVGISALTVL